MIAIPGREAHILRLTIHTKITVQELKVKTSTEVTQNEQRFYGGHKFCDLTGRGNDAISYVCRCDRPEMCLWVYLEISQAKPKSVFKMCGVSVD